MPDWWPPLLLCVFASHMPFFAWRWRRTGEVRYAATALTFTLLAVAYALRVFAPEWRWGGVSAYTFVRVPALAAAVVSIGLLVRHHVARLRA